MEPIFEFQGEYRFLSNFYPAHFVWNGYAWYNSEAAYQAAKCGNDKQVYLRFSNMENPGEAKREGKLLTLRPDWDKVKYDIMFDIVQAKFDQNPDLNRKLLETGDARLEEGNTWKDQTWGVYPPKVGTGKNWLGKILMQVRSDFRFGEMFSGID